MNIQNMTEHIMDYLTYHDISWMYLFLLYENMFLQFQLHHMIDLNLL